MYTSDGDTSSLGDGGWIAWFCGLEGHEYFCEVELDYARDPFNLCGLKSKIPLYDTALDMIVCPIAPDKDDLRENGFLELFRAATELYGLIHARYITSLKGLYAMKEKYIRSEFGVCPRLLCNKQAVLPVGLCDDARKHRVRLYCTKCQECYETHGINHENGKKRPELDGAYFGSSFPHIFFQNFTNLVPLDSPVAFIPKLFGFRQKGIRSLIEVKLDEGEFGSLAQSIIESNLKTASPSKSTSSRQNLQNRNLH
eukprot:Trichotokara_eunicae@DN5749_c1_g1_i1.p1